jgi:hypothetical protein
MTAPIPIPESVYEAAKMHCDLTYREMIDGAIAEYERARTAHWATRAIAAESDLAKDRADLAAAQKRVASLEHQFDSLQRSAADEYQSLVKAESALMRAGFVRSADRWLAPDPAGETIDNQYVVEHFMFLAETYALEEDKNLTKQAIVLANQIRQALARLRRKGAKIGLPDAPPQPQVSPLPTVREAALEHLNAIAWAPNVRAIIADAIGSAIDAAEERRAAIAAAAHGKGAGE